MIFVTAIIIVIAGLIWLLAVQVPREPSYRGKRLTVWLRTYSSSSSSGRHSREWNEADDAVRLIGTNSIPVLLHMICEKDSKFKVRLVALAQKQRLIKIHFVPAAVRNAEASLAFIVLGDMAKDAVPRLVTMYDENISLDSQCAIEDAFAWIGPPAKPAIPLLLRAATNSNSRVRANALWALGEIHTQPELCVPALIHALNDSDEWAVLSAAHALGMFGTDAQSAVGYLIKLTHAGFKSSPNSGVQVMLEARQALNKIDGGNATPTEIFPDLGIPSTDWLVYPQ
jgi:HEAT repeat protein